MKFFAHTLKAWTLSAIVTLGTTTAAHSADALVPQIVPPEAAKWLPMIPEMGNKGPAFSIVFGKPGVIGQPFGGMFRVPAGGESPLHTHTSDYWAVMVSGIESARERVEDAPVKIVPGATWFQSAKVPHINKCMGPEECVFFVYYPNGMDYIPTNTTK